MSTVHIDDELLDRYASGTAPAEMLGSMEEHLLVCLQCQDRLAAADEFVRLFRSAATQPDARPQPFYRRILKVRVLAWAGAAAMMAAAFFAVSTLSRRAPMAPATVFLHALRGPEAKVNASAGRPLRLAFDLTPEGPARDYEVQIVNPLGDQVLASPAESRDGHLSIFVRKLPAGSYWVRLYRRGSHQLLAEYGLQTNQ